MANRKTSSTRGRKISRGRIASNAVETQKTINRDYKALLQDYKKLGIELWKLPATKYVLSGAALATFVPMVFRIFKSNPQLSEFVRENVDAVEEKFEEVSEKVSDKISSLKSNARDELSEARH